MEIIAIEGNTQLLDGGAMFGNAPKAMWEQWVSVDHLNRIPLACRALLIKNWEGKNLLFEAGIGAFFEPKLRERYGVVEKEHMLLINLKKHGLEHTDIDAVILSHLHFDHAGGLLSAFEDGVPALLFSNAKYYVGAEHWKRAQNPHPRDRASFIPVLNNLLTESGRMVLVENTGICDLSPFVTMHFSQGHTPGLMLAEIHLPDAPLFFAGDLIPGLAWMHIPISMGYDRFPELVIDEKKSILSEFIVKNGRIFFTHDPKCAFGEIKQDSKGKFFAVEYRYTLPLA